MKSKKHILLVTQYFAPENFKSTDLALGLAERGYDVSVLTGIPNYPQGKFYKGYGLFSKRLEVIDGVKVYRSFLIPRGSGSGLMLALNYFSWAFFASLWAVVLALRFKYDAVMVHEPSPITQGIPAIIVKKIRRIPLLFWVLDLWPESLSSAGGVKNRSIINLFTKLTKYIYRQSDKILISSEGFKDSITSKGPFGNKIVYFPNWAEDIFDNKLTENAVIPKLPNGFILMFAGNIGVAQDFKSIMETALLLKNNRDIKFVFIGDGRSKKWVDDFIQKNSLEENCFTLGRYPLEYMPGFFSRADALLVTLKDELIFNLTVPAKIQAYMAAGKPILTMLNGEGSRLVENCGCGLIAGAGDSQTLAENIKQLSLLKQEDLLKMGNKGRVFYKKNFTKSKCLDNLTVIIEDLI